MKRTKDKNTQGKKNAWVTLFRGLQYLFPFCFSFCWDLSLRWGFFSLQRGVTFMIKPPLTGVTQILACLLQDSIEGLRRRERVLGESRIRYFFSLVFVFLIHPQTRLFQELFCFSSLSLSLFLSAVNFFLFFDFGCHERGKGVSTLWWIWFLEMNCFFPQHERRDKIGGREAHKDSSRKSEV